ncbi:glycosyltransferase [Palleniella muris]|uniref:Glycosyltransferase n=1 Tax=Palleniella muris TaxID=3038145 RepID=A0AC61QQM2_9BACT|nr:glycosyltransferase [Palleniella muris]TGX82343.1 glycosyltransferase [Palleniella muris]
MKILIYNWTPQGENGGGVAVYVNNILAHIEQHPDEFPWQIIFLSSGYYYDSSGSAYIRQLSPYHGFNSYTIVNSPAFAPHGGPAAMYKRMNRDKSLLHLIGQFIEEQGGFDVIHFQSFEGLAPNVLSLKECYPQTRFVHSLHDYGFYCSNVKLWNTEGYNCFRSERHPCGQCMSFTLNTAFYQMVSYRRRQQAGSKATIIDRLYNRLYNKYVNILPAPIKRLRQNQLFCELQQYRKQLIQNINCYIDVELAVSQRVGEIATHFGIDSKKIQVSYIGTKVADHPLPPRSIGDETGEPFVLLYMGYINVVKGAYLLLDALETLPASEAHNISLRFASKVDKLSDRQRIEALREKYASVEIIDGYTHDDFPRIFQGVHLGIVPPVWEDNLPQVTIETIAHGVPALTSCYGGAHELNNHPMFMFKDEDELVQRIITIKNTPKLLKEYWEYTQPLTTMAFHMMQLGRVYKGF